MIYAGPARTVREVAAAKELAAAVFTSHIPNPHSELAYKDVQWDDPGGFGNEDVIVVAEQPGRPLGTIRLVWRTLRRGEERWPCAGITSVAVAPEMRGRGLSRPLMQAALDACRQRGATVAVLFARRAVDDYYTRFGFFGLSSYPRLSIPHSRLPNTGIGIAPLTSDWLTWEQWRRSAYASCFGWCERDEGHWQLILKRIAFGHFDGLLLLRGGHPCGYALVAGGHVHEIALAEDSPAASCLHAIARQLGCEVLSLNIGSEHALVPHLAPYDLTLSTRQCPYGGHMLAALDLERLLAACSNRVERHAPGLPAQREEIGGLSLSWDGHKAHATLNGALDHQTLAGLIGASQPTLPLSRLDPPAPLFVPAADEF